ncbi:STAS domain-containing protein [Alteribacillus bidgolensis]|uniref:RsbT co-antagonist protein RsbR n=1 Tax=Alteribacillus bidgolensis TaxID=930129 RepID=A0A1G8HDF5_9BACI|nr:STAS domain-containing protein [Alteribacillus bidgolensis]SDI04520.1 rsbT co-antagonist protein RsbR [Alteribacillus bidgolensis]
MLQNEVKKELVELGRAMYDSRSKIAANIQKPLKEYGREQTIREETVLDFQENFIVIISEAFTVNQEEMSQKIAQWAEETSNYAMQIGVTLDQPIETVKDYRSAIWNFIQQETKEQGFSIDTVFETQKIVDPMIDKTVSLLCQKYVSHHQEELKLAQDTFLELSAPVVPITETVAVLPIIGKIDTKRGYKLMDTALQQSDMYNLDYLLLDLSGVSTVDTPSINKIHETVQSLHLLGVKAIICGVRPDLSQTMCSLDIGFDNIEVHGNLRKSLSTLGIFQ